MSIERKFPFATATVESGTFEVHRDVNGNTVHVSELRGTCNLCKRELKGSMEGWIFHLDDHARMESRHV